jgi:hypothetical protein
MSKRLTHNYEHMQFDYCYDSVAVFERDAAEHLVGLRADDVGAVICYMDANGEEAAWFDYENFVGSVRALGGTASYEC